MTRTTVDRGPGKGENVEPNGCRCSYAGKRSHDRLLGLMDDPKLLTHLIERAINGDSAYSEGESDVYDLGSIEDLQAFVAQHNWSDPVAAYDLAWNLDSLHRSAHQPA